MSKIDNFTLSDIIISVWIELIYNKTKMKIRYKTKVNSTMENEILTEFDNE